MPINSAAHIPFTEAAIGQRAFKSAGFVGFVSSLYHVYSHMKSSINKQLKDIQEAKIDDLEKTIHELRQELAVAFELPKGSEAFLALDKNPDQLIEEIAEFEKVLKKIKKEKIVRSWKQWRKALNADDTQIKTVYKAWYKPLAFLVLAQGYFDMNNMVDFYDQYSFYQGWANWYDNLFALNIDFTSIQQALMPLLVSGGTVGVGIARISAWLLGSFLRPVLSLHPGIAQTKFLENCAAPSELLLALLVTGYFEAKRQVTNEQARLAKKSEVCSAWDVWKKRHKVIKKVNKKHVAARFTGTLMALSATRMAYDFLSGGDVALMNTLQKIKEMMSGTEAFI